MENNVSTYNSKTKMDQELNPEVRSLKISIFKNKEKQGFLAYLNQ